MMARVRSREWCFTINNPTKVDNPEHWTGVKYLIWQEEAGLNGTNHFQGFVIWDNPQAMSWCKSRNGRAHWEVARGGFEANIKYCSKDEGRIAGPWIRGAKPAPGKRNDLVECAHMIDEGATMGEVALAYPGTYIRCHSGLMSYRMETYPNRHDRPTVIILWGPSGCGKSRLVHAVFPHAYRKPVGEWWDTYAGEDVVVFEDFYSWIKYDQLLRLVDWYPLLTEVKGLYTRMAATVFVFTSNQDPRLWYTGIRKNGTQMDNTALHRRFKDFGKGLIWKWDIVYEPNNVGTITGKEDWVEDTQFQ